MIAADAVPTRWIAAALLGSVVVGSLVVLSPMLAWVAVPLVAGGLVLLARPTLALPLLLVAIMLSGAGFLVGFTPSVIVPLTIAKLAALVVLGVWLCRAAFGRAVGIPPTPLAWALGCGAVALLVGLAWSADARLGIDLALGFSLLAGLALVINQLVDVRKLRASLDSMAWAYLAVLVASLVWHMIAPARVDRFVGFNLNPNDWALMVVVPLCPCIAIFRARPSWVSRMAMAATLLLAVGSVLATQSRAGLLALIVVAPVVLWLLGRRAALVALIGGAVVAAAAVSLLDLSHLTDRIAAVFQGEVIELDGSVRDRAIAQRVAWQAFLEHPWFGIGTGAFDDRSIVLSGGQVGIGTHNTYLQVLAELGLVGGAAMSLIPIAVGRSLWRTWARSGPGLVRLLAIGLLGSAVSVGALMFSATVLTQAIPFFCLALLLIAERAATGARHE